MPSLAIIIVNWNSGGQLAECLASIRQALAGSFQLRDIVVVDNASTDESASDLRLDGLPLRVLRNPVNRGFAAACNHAAADLTTDYLLFLNPDIRLYAEALAVSIAHMEQPENAAVGICGVQLVDHQERVVPSCARFPSAMNFLAATVGLDRLLPRVFPPHLMTDWRHEITADVEQVIGAFFLVRTPLFRKLEGFDERFFLYYEEVDFSLRARHAGWTSRYLVAARAFHRGEGTTDRIRAQRLFYSLRSRLLYCFKHFRALPALAVMGTTLVVEPLTRCALSLRRRGWRGLRETLTAYRALWRGLPGIARAIRADPKGGTP